MYKTNHLDIIRNAAVEFVIEGPEFLPGPSNDSSVIDLHLPDIHDRLLIFPDQSGFYVKGCHSIKIDDLFSEIAFASLQDRDPPDVSEIVISAVSDHLPFLAFRASLACLAFTPLDGFLALLEISLTSSGDT